VLGVMTIPTLTPYVVVVRFDSKLMLTGIKQNQYFLFSAYSYYIKH
jgi:hypothetical protein